MVPIAIGGFGEKIGGDVAPKREEVPGYFVEFGLGGAAEFVTRPVGDRFPKRRGFLFEALEILEREAEGEGFGGFGHGEALFGFYLHLTKRNYCNNLPLLHR